MAKKITVSCESLVGCLYPGAEMARNPVCLCTILCKNWVISVEFPSPIVAVFEKISVEYTQRILYLLLDLRWKSLIPSEKLFL